MADAQTLQGILQEWHPPLRKRTGSPMRLAGLDVYYDFDWMDVIGHDRAAFRNGQDLAERVRDGCPDGETPCLLLTTKDDVEDELLYTNDANYVFVMRIHRYLSEARAGAAANYLVGKFGVGSIITARQIRKAISDPGQQDKILEQGVTREGLKRWAGRRRERPAMLHAIADAHTETYTGVVEDSPSARDAVKGWIRSGGTDAVREVADELAGTKEGRRAFALADPTSGRAEDVRDAARDYRELLASENASETDFQDFITESPLLLGLEYAEVMSRVRFLRGELDFVVRRYDGYRDLLELKGPNEEIIRFRGGVESQPSAYSLAPKLSQALAQVQVYREWIAKSSKENLDLYGVTRDPRITIVIGRDSDLPNETARQILRQLNVSLHRMTVLPYDILADRAEAQFCNLALFS